MKIVRLESFFCCGSCSNETRLSQCLVLTSFCLELGDGAYLIGSHVNMQLNAKPCPCIF